jgi:hypothetical protein
MSYLGWQARWPGREIPGRSDELGHLASEFANAPLQLRDLIPDLVDFLAEGGL